MDNIKEQEEKQAANIANASTTARNDLHSVIDKVAEKVPAAADRLSTSAHNSVDKVADKVSSLSDKLSGKGEQLSASYKRLADSGHRMAETGRGYVRKSPAISVLVAMAAGYAVSKLIGSRKH